MPDIKTDKFNILKDSALFSSLDLHFAQFMLKLEKSESYELYLAAALASKAIADGSICLDLATDPQRILNQIDTAITIDIPSVADWIKVLQRCSVVGVPGDRKPLILEDTRLYLYRYWEYEQQLAKLLIDKASAQPDPIDPSLLREQLLQIFTIDKNAGADWQMTAAALAITKKLCIISGGPGTGKTYTAASIIKLLAACCKPLPRIALAAPTGKAAARLWEALVKSFDSPQDIQLLDTLLPNKASTIHRLLGSIQNSPYFRYNPENPLPYDTVIVDEASMIDLALMYKLVSALDAKARLIILGDKDQLASVEAGAVLASICAYPESMTYSSSCIKQLSDFSIQIPNQQIKNDARSPLRDSMVILTKNYRFPTDSGIGLLSRTINQGASEQAFKVLHDNTFTDCSWETVDSSAKIPDIIKPLVLEHYVNHIKADTPQIAFEEFSKFRILCAVRQGTFGAELINVLVEQILHHQGIIDRSRHGPWYHGRPVLITTNDYSLGLFNGDIGIAQFDHEHDNNLRVFFQKSDNTFRSFTPQQLPEHENVYAMTVHKSQGSEFEKCLLILPDKDVPVLTRELLYTAITRAKKQYFHLGKKGYF